MKVFWILLACLGVAACGNGNEAAKAEAPNPSQDVVVEDNSSLPAPPDALSEHDKDKYEARVAEFEARGVEPGGLAMVGDSLTEHGDWNALLPGEVPVNFGIVGDIAEGVEARLSQVEAAEPEKVLVMIGTNDLALGMAPEEIGDGVEVILDRLQAVMPANQVYVQSVLPREPRFQERIRKLNERLVHEAYMRGMWFVFLHDAFLDEAGNQMNPALTVDGLHLNDAGYAIWAEMLQPYLDGYEVVPGLDAKIPAHYPPGGKLHYTLRYTQFEMREVETGGVAFVGDSITEGGDWAALFPDVRTVNFGIGWDQTSGLLLRIDQIEEAEPEKIVLMIGTNDIGNGRPVEEAAANTREIIQRFKELVPPDDILLQSLPPRGADLNEEVLALNERLQAIAEEEGVDWLDIYTPFVEDDHLDPSVTFDSLHFNQSGYRRWKGLIATWLTE